MGKHDNMEKNQRFDPGQVKNDVRKRLWSFATRSIVIAFLVCYFVIVWFFLTVRIIGGPGALDWGLLEGFVSLVMLMFVAGSVIFVISEHADNEIQQKREEALACLDVYQKMFDRLMSEEDIVARRWIITQIKPYQANQSALTKDEWLQDFQEKLFHSPDDWTDEDPPGHAYLKRVLNTFDFIGFVDEHYWGVIDNELASWMSAPVAKVWRRIDPYIVKEIDVRKAPDYYESACRFGEKCIQWRHDQGLPEEEFVEGSV